MEKPRIGWELLRQIFDGDVYLSSPVRPLAIRTGKVHGRDFPGHVIDLRNREKRGRSAKQSVRGGRDGAIAGRVQVRGDTESLLLQKAEQGLFVGGAPFHCGRGLFSCHEAERFLLAASKK